MEKQILLLPGDGIGPEIIAETKRVLEEIARLYHHTFQFVEGRIGGDAIDATGSPLPEETLDLAKGSDAILLGAVGGPKWDGNAPEKRPEKGLLQIRKALGLYANLRPVRVLKPLMGASTLKEEVLADVDLLIVRELTGGLYFGEPRERRQINGEDGAVDTLLYTRGEIERIVHQAFQFARTRKKRVVSVDKANVLESSRLWREIADEVAREYPDVTLSHMLVDNAAMQLIRDPRQFDVIVTENLFGDILSDEASMITGSLGLLPSASMNTSKVGLFEPVHGSAPDIAGTGAANPLATILSAAMMLQYSFGLADEAKAIEVAVDRVLAQGVRTKDIAKASENAVSTTAITNAVMEALALKSASSR